MVQVFVPGLGRKTVRLGPVPPRAAERFREKVEALVACKRLNQPPDPEMAGWLAGVSDDVHRSLGAIGLAEPRGPISATPTLEAFLAKYIAQRGGEITARSIELLGQTKVKMIKTFGANTPLDRITPDHAADWRAAMVGELSEATTRLHTRNAKTFFNNAVDRELIDRNPFRMLPSSAVAANRDHYVSVEDAERVMARLPDREYRLLFGLARFAGLRVPSETHILTWDRVNLQAGRLSVYAPKTGSTRVVPIVPRLSGLLKVAWSQREPEFDQVLTVSTNNMHRTVRAAIQEAGVEPWPDLFQALRRSCETDLAMTFPQHAVSSWLGHGIGVSAKHYLQIPAELYERAAAMNGSSALHQALQQRPELSRTEPQTHKTLKIAPSGDAA